MGAAAEHEFHRQYAAPALVEAMTELCERSDLTLEQAEGMTLGEAYRRVLAVYGDEVPQYWRIWNQWNEAPDDPAPMGEL